MRRAVLSVQWFVSRETQSSLEASPLTTLPLPKSIITRLYPRDAFRVGADPPPLGGGSDCSNGCVSGGGFWIRLRIFVALWT